jgi:diacylglycerol kinase (ATP)
MKKLIHSFGYAFEGIYYLIKTQQNARIHLSCAMLALIMGFWLKIATYEWFILFFSIAIVLAFEAFNTALETLCDLVHPDVHPKIKLVKDLSAAAVLIGSITALVSGIMIFLPKLILYFF